MGSKLEEVLGFQETAFQTFVYSGRPLRDYSGVALSEKQDEAYELMKKGMTAREVADKMEITKSSVLSMFTSIRKKGWSI